MGFFNVSEVPEGAVVAGPLPGDLQGYTVYEAAVLTKGSRDDAAIGFAKFLGSPGVAAIWQASKLEPAGR
jgi:ABC-type molybdate transport system substrate-binding protein